MRKVVLTEFVSLDGVMEAPHEWHFPFFNDEGGKYKFDELMASDALLLGRVTYEGFAAAWPTMPDTGEFGERMNSLPKYVVSTTLDTFEWNNSHLIKGDLSEEITRLKDEPGQDILLSGSADLVNSMIPLNLIDEYRLMVHPVVVGKGKRLFKDGIDLTALKLVEATPLSTGIVILTYVPAKEGQ